jgi:hypothetical protein
MNLGLKPSAENGISLASLQGPDHANHEGTDDAPGTHQPPGESGPALLVKMVRLRRLTHGVSRDRLTGPSTLLGGCLIFGNATPEPERTLRH